MLKGHCLSAGSRPCLSLRKLSQCDPPASSVVMIPMTSNVVPIRVACRCNQTVSASGFSCRNVRKNATMPKPKLVIASAVRTHARVVRSRASWVRNFAMLVLS